MPTARLFLPEEISSTTVPLYKQSNTMVKVASPLYGLSKAMTLQYIRAKT